MPTNPEWIIDITHPEQQGLLREFGSTVRENPPRFVTNDGVKRRIRLVTRRRTEGGFDEWDDVDKTGLTVECAIGNPDRGPEGGTFSGSHSGNTTGLVGLSWNITAAALQAALNSNPSVTAGGQTVTVLERSDGFLVTWSGTGAKAPLVFDSTNLVPRTKITVQRITPGTGTIREQQTIRFAQAPYAYNATWTNYVVGSVTVTQVQAGTATKKEIQRLTISEPPYRGSMFINFPRPEIVKLTAKANTAAKEKTRIAPLKDNTAGGDSINNTWFDLYGANNAPRRFWFNVGGGGTAPPTPSGGSVHAVAVAANATQYTVAVTLQSVIDAHADFTADLGSTGSGASRVYHIDATDAAFGSRTDATDTGGSGATITVLTQGTHGALNGTHFVLYDDEGSVGVWFNVAGSSTIPTGAAEQTRAIEITTVNAGDSATQVATVLQSVIDADADFTATRVGNVVTITDAVGGERENASAGDTGFGITTTQEGASITASVPYNVSAKDLMIALSNAFDIIKSGEYTWEFTFKTVGSQPLIQCNAAALFPSGFEGSLNLNTVEMWQAFQAAEASGETVTELDAFLEIQMTYAGELPLTALRVPVKIVRDVISPDTMLPLFADYLGGASRPRFSAYRSSTPGGQTILAGDENVIGFDTEEFDSTGAYDPTTFRFTPQTAGAYHFSAAAYCQGINDGEFVAIRIRKNGTAIASNSAAMSAPVMAGDMAMHVSRTAYANGSTDFFDVTVYNATGSSLNVGTDLMNTFFSGFFIGE